MDEAGKLCGCVISELNLETIKTQVLLPGIRQHNQPATEAGDGSGAGRHDDVLAL